MRTAQLASLILLAPLAACADDAVRATDRAAESPTATPDAAVVAATPAGLAAAVIGHLGRWVVVEASGGITDMEDTRELGVDLRLRDAGQHNRLSIQAPDPDYLPGDGEVEPCEDEGRVESAEGTFECRTLPDGGTLQLGSTPFGFSDDNTDGSAAMVMVSGPDRELTIMWETYDPEASLSDAVLMEIATDPLVGWTTSSANNAAGERIEGFSTHDRVDRDGEEGYDEPAP
jgi:hypothetical protein